MTDVGFTTGPIGGYAQPQDTNLSEIPSTLGESMDWFQTTKQLGRASERFQMQQPLLPEQQQTTEPGVDPMNLGSGPAMPDGRFASPGEIQQRQNDTLTKDDANTQFGIDGELKFDGPVLKGVAQNLYEAKLDELKRRSIAERAPPGFFNGLSRFGANFVANFLDPLNVAASFIPVVGEARYAEWLAEAGGAGARAGIRAGVGAAAGAIGQVPLTGLQYALSKNEQADYSATQAMLDIATGALIGGVLHVGGGFVKDRITGEYRPATPTETRTTTEPLTLSQAIREAPAPTQETALRSAISAAVEGRPVEVAPLFEAAGEPLRISDLSPAIRDENGAVHIGQPGEMHIDVASKLAPDERFTNDLVDRWSMGFVTKDGTFLTREEAARALGPNAPSKTKQPQDTPLGAQDLPDRMQGAVDRATEPPLGRPGEPLPDREHAAAQRAAAEVLAKTEPKEPVKAIEAKMTEDVGRLAAAVAAPVEKGPKGEKVVSFKRAGEGKMAITDESSKLASDAEAATLEAAVKAGTLPAEDLASLKEADAMIAHADVLEKAYAAAADCPALKGS